MGYIGRATALACSKARLLRKETDILIEKETDGELSEEDIKIFELLLGRPPYMNKKKKRN